MMKIQFVLLLFLFTLIACNSDVEEKPIARQDFINLLIDLHKFDAVASDYSLNAEMVTIDSALLYSSILNKYNTNKDEFETTMRWYTKHPEDLTKIYDEVFGELDKENEALNKEGEMFNGRNTERIFADTKYQFLKGDTIKYPDPYVIEIKDTGTYLFEVKAKLFKEDKSKAPYLTIYFIKDKADSKPEERLFVANMPMPKSNYSRDYQFIFKLESNDYKYVKIVLPDTPDREVKQTKSLQISKIRVLLNKLEVQESPEVDDKK